MRNFFGFGEEVWRHSLLAFLVFGWWEWTKVLSPVTILPRKPSPSASKRFKSPGRHQHVILSILQSAGVASNLQALYGTAEHHGRYVVLIHDSYPDVRLFHALLRSDLPSRWLQLLQWPLVSLLGVPDVLQNERRLETSYSVRTLAVVTDMHHRTELPFVDEFRWVSTPHFVKKRMTESCSSLVPVASGAAIFTLLLRRCVAFLYRTATCRPFFKP